MSTEILHQMMDKLVSIESHFIGMETRMDETTLRQIITRLNSLSAAVDSLITRVDLHETDIKLLKKLPAS